jgi:hypothetical protein
VAQAWATDYLESEAIRDLPPLPKVVIFALDRGISKLLSSTNISFKRTAAPL